MMYALTTFAMMYGLAVGHVATGPVLIPLTVPTAQSTDTHVPSFTQAGDVITIDAEFAWISQQPTEPSSFQLLSGTPAVTPSSIGLNSGNRTARIEYRLSPGQWQITAMGHADDLLNPSRQRREFSITVTGPTREQQLQEIAKRLIEVDRDFAILGATIAERAQAVLAVIDPPAP